MEADQLHLYCCDRPVMRTCFTFLSLLAPPQVVLASNSAPALNDVTNGELQILTESIAAMDPVIR